MLTCHVRRCLAWQKGQGVPQRYHKAQDQYQALVLEIEMAERSFIDLETSKDPEAKPLYPHAEKARLQKLYDTAWADQQANYPDLYVSTGAAAAKATGDIAEQLKKVKEEAAKAQSELEAKITKLTQQVEGKVATRVEGAVVDTSKK